MPTPVQVLQRELEARLVLGFGRANVKYEWDSFLRGGDFYSPRPDLALGPLSQEPGTRPTELAAATVAYRRWINELFASDAANARLGGFPRRSWTVEDALHVNFNPRCFIAIEIENSGTRKHMMGSALNAAALGKLGVLVGFTDKAVETLLSIRRYLVELVGFHKNSIDPRNLLVLSKRQMEVHCRSTHLRPTRLRA